MACSIVVLISGSGSNLQAIMDACSNGTINGSIAAVISNRPNVKGLARAANAGIETITLDHKSFEGREAFDTALARSIEQFSPDLVVLAGFMRILTPTFTERFQGKMLNIHPSLLPKYPGLNTHQRALDAGDSEHGVTVHFVTAELDGGPAVIQARVPIAEDDTAETLAAKVLREEHTIYPQAVAWFAAGRLLLDDSTAKLDGREIELN